MFLDFLDYLTCWMFVETPICFQSNLQDAVGPCFKVLLDVSTSTMMAGSTEKAELETGMGHVRDTMYLQSNNNAFLMQY